MCLFGLIPEGAAKLKLNWKKKKEKKKLSNPIIQHIYCKMTD